MTNVTDRLWSLPQWNIRNLSSIERSKPVVTLAGHGDVIRCMALWEDKKSDCEWKLLAMTGSYDHSIRVWNVQDIDKADNKGNENRCISILSHGAPVESVCLMKSDDRDVPVWLLSAGGTVIKVWNPITGHCQATITTQHRKTITSLLPVIRSDYLDDGATTKQVSWRIMT